MSTLALIVVLVAAPIAYLLQWLWLRDRYAKRRTEDVLEIAALKFCLEEARRVRDSHADALHDILDRADWAADPTAIRAAARTALETGSYTGDLTAARVARDEIADLNAALRAELGRS